MSDMTTWRKELGHILKGTGDMFDDLEFNIHTVELDREFDGGYGSAEGTQFVAWSPRYVYFSREYDGSDFIDYVERHPPGFLDKEVERIVLGNDI